MQDSIPTTNRDLTSIAVYTTGCSYTRHPPFIMHPYYNSFSVFSSLLSLACYTKKGVLNRLPRSWGTANGMDGTLAHTEKGFSYLSRKASLDGSASQIEDRAIPVGRENLSEALPPRESYECRHCWDPLATWTEQEECRLVRKTDIYLLSWICVKAVSVEVESSTDLPLTGFCARLRQKERNLRPGLHELTRIVGEAHHGFTLVNG